MTQAGPVYETPTKGPALHGRWEHADKCLAVESVFYALFRVAELAEYAGSDKAVEWARGALDDRQLLHGFVERVRAIPRGETPSAASRLAAGPRSH